MANMEAYAKCILREAELIRKELKPEEVVSTTPDALVIDLNRRVELTLDRRMQRVGGTKRAKHKKA